MPYRMRDVEQVVAEFQADGQPYGVFIDNNLGSRPEYLRKLCRFGRSRRSGVPRSRRVRADGRRGSRENRLECATFHILTPYPGTPLFHQMETEGRLLHKDWSGYDTAHVVFQPKNMTAAELADGYAWSFATLLASLGLAAAAARLTAQWLLTSRCRTSTSVPISYGIC